MIVRELAVLSINGTRRNDLLPDVAELEVEEQVDAADVFRIRLTSAQLADGSWRHLEDPDLAIWNRIAIQAGYPDNHELLIDGYITHVDVALSGSGAADSFVELSGTDASVVMDLQDRQVAWPNKKDSDIAQAIFDAYGLSWEVEDTELLHAERLATILQSETDIRFLQRLAARNGFECFVRGNRGYFRSANLQDPPQRPLTVPVGNLTTLRFAVDGTPPTELEIRRLDPFEKREDREVLSALPERQLARRSLATLRGDTRPGRRLLRQQPTVSRQELQARLRAGYAGASGFAVASGELDGRSYGAVLRSRRLVAIGGAGPSHSGHYYVTRVRHVFSGDSYVQSFEARRNAIGLLGTESFAAPPARPPITPGAGAPAIGNRLLPAQQSSPTEGGT
jgi:late control gene D protein (GPD)